MFYRERLKLLDLSDRSRFIMQHVPDRNEDHSYWLGTAVGGSRRILHDGIATRR